MTKLSLLVAAPIAALLTASASQAQQCAGHCSQCQVQSQYGGGSPVWDEVKASYHENAMWPGQYVQPSRRAICRSFDLMIANGWRRNNLLTKYDFATEGEGLSEAGKLRVSWILTQAPPNRRTIFVQRGADEAATAARIEAVQTLAADLGPGAGPADVQETLLRDEGHPATSVDAVFTGFSTNQMPPVLPSSGGSAASTSTGQ
jgi:hypothetical protein